MKPFVRLAACAALVVMASAGLCIANAAPAPAAGGKAVTLPIPAKAQLVVQINGVEQARERLGKLLTAAAPNEAGAVNKAIDEGLGKLLEGRKTTAIPKDGRWYLVARDLGTLGEEDSPIAVLVPVTDAKAFRATFLTGDEQKSYNPGEGGIATFKFAFKGNELTIRSVELPGYVVLTPSPATAEFFVGKYDKPTVESLGAGVSESFLGADLSVYLNMDAVNDQYGQQIQAFRQFMDFAIQQAAQAGGQGVSKKQLEAAKVMFKGVFQGLEDARAFVIGTEFRPEGLAVRLHARFEDGSSTGKLLKNETPTALGALDKLPRGLANYSDMQVGTAVLEIFKDLMQQAAPGGDEDEKATEAFKKYLAEVQAAGPQGQSQAASPPEVTLGVLRFKDVNKAVAAETKMYKTLPAGGFLLNLALKDKPEVTEKAHKVGGFTLNEAKLVFDFDATAKELPDNIKEATIASMKRMMAEKTSCFYGTDGKVMLNVLAKDWATAEKTIEEYLSGKATLGSDASFKLTRKNLPSESSIIGIVDTSKLIVMLGDYMKGLAQALPGFPAQIPTLKPAKGDPAYVGVSLLLKPETLQADFFIPVTAFQVGRKVLAPILQNVE